MYLLLCGGVGERKDVVGKVSGRVVGIYGVIDGVGDVVLWDYL